jgi:eukaryotic-like serine/threonine-protein kinase
MDAVRRLVGIVVAGVALACVAAAAADTPPGPPDWAQYGRGPGHASAPPAGAAPATPATVHAVWSRAIPGGSDGGGPAPSPVATGGLVIAGSPGGTLTEYGAATGAVIWQVATGGPDSTPALGDGSLYVGVGAPVNRVEAFTITAGRPLWSQPTDASGWVDSPSLVGGVVIVGTGLPGQAQPGGEYAFSASTGQPLWHLRIATAGGALSPAVAAGVAYLATPGDFASTPVTQPARLVAVNSATGAILWSRTPAVGVFQSPTVVGSRVYVPGVSGLEAFSTAGTPLWTNAATANGGEFTTPAVSGGVLYTGSEEGPCPCAFSAGTGHRLWHAASALGDQFSPATVTGGVAWFVDEDRLEALDAATGATRFTATTATGGQPVAAGGAIYTEGARLTAWRS